MSMQSKFRRLFRFDNDHHDVSRAVDDELQFHFDSAVRDLMAKGANESDARRQAEARFGDVERTRSGLKAIDHARVSESRRIELLSNIAQDVRYAFRGLKRNPVFALAVITILALGIGANSTMFGIVDRLLLRAPKFLANADRVQRVYLSMMVNGSRVYLANSSYHRFHDLTDSSSTIEVAAAVWSPTLAIGAQNAREFRVTYATATYWQLFNIRPALGRFYAANEDTPTNAANVAVISYPWWQSEYGGADSVLGKTVRMGRLYYTIIGVTPKSFAGLGTETPIAWIPLSSGANNSFPGNGRTHWYETYGMNWLQPIVRRKPNVPLQTTNADLSHRFQQSYQASRVIEPSRASIESVKPFAEVSSILVARGPNRATEVKVAIWLVGVAIIVLLIACANVGNLMLARAIQRQREIAVRLALGISRSRLTLQILVESTVLALLGGAAGLAVTEWGGRLLRATLLPDLATTSSLSDIRTPLFTLCVAIAVGAITGLIPAWRSGRSSLALSLKTGGREGNYQRSRLRSSLLVVQSAMSVVLLVGAGLFVRSLHNLQSMRLGFDANHIVWVSPHMRGVALDSARQRVFYDELVRTAKQLPGVENASLGVSVPFATEWEEPLFVAGIDSVDKLGAFETQVVGPEYFQMMGTRIVSGRAIGVEDGRGTAFSMVVSESMAKKLWPGENALTKCVRIGADTNPCRAVVGLAEDIKSTSLTNREQWQYYVPRTQYDPGDVGELFVRVRGSATAEAERLRVALQKLMPGDSYLSAKSLDDVLDPGRRSWQLGATMFSVFGTLALLVAAIGLYSVISYTVAQRTREMGVRVALGAQSTDVVRMILRQSVALSGIAVVVGVAVALVASKWVEPLLFETSARDPLVYASVAGLLLLVALAAALAPALRAARVDASIALRSD
ncbi:MAG: ADOP family duplicated permease [Gemmatimonas sp.]